MRINKEIVMVRLSDIIPNRFQPRLTFDEEALNELAASIKEHGIIQPLILRDLGNKYEIIAGERRYKAAQLAGVLEVPAVIGQMDDQTSAELALIENIQRKDLSAIEEAKSYKKILDMGGFTQDELSKRMGKGQSTIANKMRLLTLTNEVQAALMNNLISERHARCLLQVKDETKQKEVLNKIITERMNVRDTDNYIKSIIGMNAEQDKDLEPNPKVEISEIRESTIPEIKENIVSESKETPIEEVKLPEARDNENNNPNIYTQTNNVDFIDLNNLTTKEDNNIENIPTETSINLENKNELNLVEPVINNFSKEKKEDNYMDSSKEKNKDKQDNLSKIKMATAIRLAKDTLEDMKAAGYQASIEEHDGDSIYQIIINIIK